MRPSILRAGWLAVYAVGTLATASTASAVVQFTVDSILDQVDDDTADGLCHTAANTCTLRAAVMQADVVSGAGATIVLPAGTYTFTRPSLGANGPESGDLNLTAPAVGDPLISIVGAGRAATIIDANQLDRVFDVAAGRSATLSDLTLRNGYVSAPATFGGGLQSSGTLTLNRCTVSGNQTAGSGRNGGGIYSNGYLYLNDSTVSGNTSQRAGAGIYSGFIAVIVRSTVSGNSTINFEGGGIASYGPLSVTDSTISGNTANDGGGIFSFDTLTMTNATIVSNGAYNDGGGIAAVNANIYNSTIAFNGADIDADPNGGSGGGIFDWLGGTLNLRNTLVAGNNLSGAPVYEDCFGTLHSYGRNLFSDASNCSVITATGSWALLNSLGSLGSLTRNGGPTATVTLLSGSNAIDGGDPTFGCVDGNGQLLPTDQRGAARVRGARCDVGAYESGTLFFDGFEAGDVSAW